jgi:hypothetical protein
MANPVRVKFNDKSFYELRRSTKVVSALQNMGSRIVNGANKTLPEGDGYRMSSQQGQKRPQGRWAVRVYTRSNHAKRSNAKHHTLLRLLDDA